MEVQYERMCSVAEKKEPAVDIREITPELAAHWIKSNHERQRKRRSHKSQEYAADMRANKWFLSNQMIIFDVDGDLINGQHTLDGVVLSKKTIKCVVAINWPKASILVMDAGMKRNSDDHFGMAGKGYPKGCGATVRAIFKSKWGGGAGAMSDLVVDAFMQSHGDAVASVHKAFSGCKYGSGPVKAVACRALISRNVVMSRLERFAEVLDAGIMRPGEDGAVVLRNWVIQHGAANWSANSRKAFYGTTEHCLRAFIDKKEIKRAEEAKAELFPIPEDGEKQLGKR